MNEGITHRWTEQLLGLTDPVDEALAGLVAADVVDRIWQRDRTVWTAGGSLEPAVASDDPDNADGLGWLANLHEMREETSRWRALTDDAAADGFTRAVVVIAGLDALVLRTLLAADPNGDRGMPVHVLDSASPDAWERVSDTGDAERTLFIVSAHDQLAPSSLALFSTIADAGVPPAAIVAIADEHGEFARLVDGGEYRQLVTSRSDVAPGFAALTPHILLPAAVAGIDVRALLDAATETAGMLQTTGGPAANLGLRLGATIAAAVRADRPLITIVADAERQPLATWIRRIVGSGLGPAGAVSVTETDADVAALANRRISIGTDTGRGLNAVVGAGHPAVALEVSGPGALGAHLLTWQFAVAVAAAALEHDPFVSNPAHRFERATLARLGSNAPSVETTNMEDALVQLGDDGLLHVAAHIDPDGDLADLIVQRCEALRDKLGLVVDLDFGPIGHPYPDTLQIHTVQLVDDRAAAGEAMSLASMALAAADAELDMLIEAGRPTARLMASEFLR